MNQKKNKKKTKEIIILLLVALWFIIFLVNYLNYSNGKKLIFSITKTREYNSGTITEYYSLGYIYRIYDLNNLKKEELVPIWKKRTSVETKNGLPITAKDYNVPENENHSDKYKGLLYFYDQNRKLIGTYKCLNTTRDCNKAIGGKDEYDIYNTDLIYKRDETIIDSLYDKYAFIEDSEEQYSKYGDEDYIRTIYLFDIVKNELIARYYDIKSSYKDEYTNRYVGDNYNYIVKNEENKWGIIKINEDGSIEESLPFEYDSINYDVDTKYYIVSKDNKWFIYNLDIEDKVSYESDDIIYDVWINSNKTRYIKIGKKNEDGNTYFTINRIDGEQFLADEKIGAIYPTKDMILYADFENLKLKIMNYAKEQLNEIDIYFTSLIEDDTHHPSFKIDDSSSKSLKVTIYYGTELKYKYETKTITIDGKQVY